MSSASTAPNQARAGPGPAALSIPRRRTDTALKYSNTQSGLWHALTAVSTSFQPESCIQARHPCSAKFQKINDVHVRLFSPCRLTNRPALCACMRATPCLNSVVSLWKSCARSSPHAHRGTRAQTSANIAACSSSPRATLFAVSSFAVYATTVSIEKARRASATDMVPIDEDRRPEKGTISGERPH